MSINKNSYFEVDSLIEGFIVGFSPEAHLASIALEYSARTERDAVRMEGQVREFAHQAPSDLVTEARLHAQWKHEVADNYLTAAVQLEAMGYS